MGNIIKLSSISATIANFVLPLNGEFLNELSYEGSYINELNYEGYYVKY